VQVYQGKACLNTIQISALLALDTRRALDRASTSVKSLDEQCCDVQAVFGDIQHSGGKPKKIYKPQYHLAKTLKRIMCICFLHVILLHILFAYDFCT
jgi:hypothetical protein